MNKIRCRGGWNHDRNDVIICIVTGEMADGRKVWTECDENKNPINTDKQYILQTRGDFSEFVRL